MTSPLLSNPSELQKLTRTVGKAQRIGYGLAGGVGGVLLLANFALFWHQPAVSDALATKRALFFGTIWVLCLPIFKAWYSQPGRVTSTLSLKERQAMTRFIAFLLICCVTVSFLIPWADTLRGWPVTNRSFSVIFTLMIVALARYLTRHDAVVYMLFAIVFLSDALPQLNLPFFHTFRTLPILLAAFGLLLTGSWEHWQFLQAKRQFRGQA